MLPILQHYEYQTSNSKGLVKKTTLSSLGKMGRINYYKTSIESLMDNPATCILSPKLDQYWHEEHLHRIKASTSATSSRRVKRSPTTILSNNLPLHICGICGKRFLSRFYLDYHVETKHANSSKQGDGLGNGDVKGEGEEVFISSNRGMDICPGDNICERLGGRNICEKRALQDEPFYAPGIHDESSMYSQSIKRKFQKLAAHDKPCDQRTRTIQDCHEMFQTCFGSNDRLVHDLTSLLCDTQSCHHELHSSIFGSVLSIHSGRDYWDSHHDNINSVGIFLILFIAGTILYYWNTLHRMMYKHLRRRKKKNFFDVTQVKKFD